MGILVLGVISGLHLVTPPAGKHPVCPRNSANAEGPVLLCMPNAKALAIDETERLPCRILQVKYCCGSYAFWYFPIC